MGDRRNFPLSFPFDSCSRRCVCRTPLLCLHFWGRLKMSSVKYNLKISNCNILTYINIGTEWESNWRRGQKPSLLLEQKSLIMLNVRMVHRYSLFILHTAVVLIPPHFPVFRTVPHFSTACGLFFPMRSQESGGKVFLPQTQFHSRDGIFTWERILWPGAKIWNEFFF